MNSVVTPGLPQSMVDILGASALFQTLDACALVEIAAMAERVQVASGTVLFRQGETGDSLYIVVHGRLRVDVEPPSGSPQWVGEVGRGESVGEMALLTHEPRSATVTAIRNTELIKLTQDSFEQLSARHPQALRLFAQLLTERLRQTLRANPLTTSPLSTLAILPLGDDVPVAEFANALTSALATFGSVRCLTHTLVAERWSLEPGDDSPPDRALTQWLNAEEDQHRFLLYVADPHWSVWTQHCIQQADRILLVAQQTADPRPSPLEAALADYGQTQTLPKMELVLLHGDRTLLPAKTRRWLLPRHISRHHHVHLSDRRDFDRLARFMTGQAVGLVLGGGGARAFAHIGVLRALREAGIPIDIIGGTSMGAIIAAQYAAGWDHDRMVQANKHYFQHTPSLMDYTIPLVSLIKGRQFVKILQDMFGETQVEDLWLPYFCVSSNLTRAQLMVHRSGSLPKWLGASISIPGIGPPLCSHQDLLVDGGVLNNLPVDVMRDQGPGSIIAVDVGAEVELKAQSGQAHLPSPWKLLWHQINPFVDRLDYPAMGDILWRAATLGSKRSVQLAAAQCSLFIQPPLQPFKIFDWNCLETMSDISYRFAQAKIAQWPD